MIALADCYDLKTSTFYATSKMPVTLIKIVNFL